MVYSCKLSVIQSLQVLIDLQEFTQAYAIKLRNIDLGNHGSGL